MARKRANGEGSYYQLQDRTWVYQVTVGKKADGSPQRKSFKGRTKAICKQRKEEWDIAQATIQERMEQERLEELFARGLVTAEEAVLGTSRRLKRCSATLLWSG